LGEKRVRISTGDFLSYIPAIAQKNGRFSLVDRTDRKILAELQKDGRLSVTELADRVGLSLSPCHRRLKALEESGAILGYHARLAPSALGLNFAALVFVTLREVTRQPVADFEAAVAAIPQIVEAQRLFGDPDYLLHVVTRDLPAFQKLYDEQLTSIPNVQRLSSTLVMKEVLQDRQLPM
jgi:DNA-binding Lrp family transcriptional regulator